MSLIVLPLMLLFAWAALRTADQNRQIIEMQRNDVTNKVSSAIDLNIAGVIGMLTGLVGGQDLQNGSFADFQRQAEILVKQPSILRVWAFDKSGAFVSGTLAQNATPPAVTDSSVVNQVFGGQSAVSSVSGEGGDKAKVTIAVPAVDASRVAFGVAAEVGIAKFSNLFAKEGMEPHWAAAVVDGDGRYVARSLDAEKRLGQIARPELGNAARNPVAVGTFKNTTYEGVQMLNSYRRSSLTGWTTVVAVPLGELAMPVRRAIALLFLAGLLILAGTLAVTSLLAARISGPVSDLSRYANSLATGKPFTGSPHHIIELDEVRDALDNALAQSARLASLVASSGDAIMSVDLDGNILSWNGGAERLFGFTESEIVGRPKTVIVPKNRLAEFQAVRDKVLAGETVRVDTQRLRKDGSVIEVSLDSAPIRRPDGEIFAISSIIHDITDRKASEEHTFFLMRELAHRSKNQLAIIQSIASQTARNTKSNEEFLETFGKRLQGLSVSHDLLSNQNWRSVALADLAKSQLSVFVGWPSERVALDGPMVKLTPAHAESIGLALHELATNSAKYGALSVPEGRVKITWKKVANGASAGKLSVDWQEMNGPPVEAPQHKGFGTLVIERMVAQSVNGTAQIEYRPDGVHWHLEYPYNGASPAPAA